MRRKTREEQEEAEWRKSEEGQRWLRTLGSGGGDDVAEAAGKQDARGRDEQTTNANVHMDGMEDGAAGAGGAGGGKVGEGSGADAVASAPKILNLVTVNRCQ